MKFVLGVILLVLWGCSSSPFGVSTKKKSDIVHEDKITKKLSYKSSICNVKGRYVVDEELIIRNQNLEKLVSSLEIEKLQEKKDAKEIPGFIKTFLKEISGIEIKLAKYSEDWQSGCSPQIEFRPNKNDKLYEVVEGDTLLVGIITNKKLPTRQLIYFGQGDEIALLAFYKGGIGVSERILIFQYENEKIIDFWCGGSLKDLLSKEEIIAYLKKNIENP